MRSDVSRSRRVLAGVAAFSIAAAVAGSGASFGADPAPATEAAAIEASRSAVAALAERLKGALQAAMRDGGPLGALDVCKTIAPRSAADVGSERGVVIKRTGLRIRNPSNVADPFELRILTSFQSRADAGADVRTLEYSEIVESGGARALRYVKAIPMADQPCSSCHGTNIERELLETIRQLYPADAATGFKPGELRGAFSVISPVE